MSCHELIDVINKGDIDKFREILVNTSDKELNVLDKNKMAPFHYAVKQNDFEMVKELSDRTYADVIRTSNKQRQNFLHFACYNGNTEIIKMLLPHIDNKLVSEKEKNGRTPFHNACNRGDYENFRMILPFATTKLLVDVDWLGITPFHYSIFSENINIIDKLIKIVPREAFSIKDVQGNLPLHTNIRKGNLKVFDLLYTYVSDSMISVKNEIGKTPLHVAVDYDRVAFIKKILPLINRRHIYETDIEGRNVLHNICRKSKCEILDLVKKYISDESFAIEDKYKINPLQYATRYGSHELLETIFDLTGKLPIDSKVISKKAQGFRVGENLLHLALNNRDEKVLELIVKKGRTEGKIEKWLSEKNINGDTPMMFAVKSKKAMQLEKLINVTRAKIFKSEGKKNTESSLLRGFDMI